MEGLGVHKFWGLSPAVDLVKTYYDATGGGETRAKENSTGNEQLRSEIQLEDGDDEELRFLCIGAGDVRTIANLRRDQAQKNSEKKVRLYLFDTPIESLARHLLLLAIATDWELPLQKRVNIFLEVLGNAKVQERTSKYIAKVATNLVRFVCNDEGPLRRLVDLSYLKFRETDALEQILKSWSENTPFDVDSLRDGRLRQFYGQRYDHRPGLIDGDYQNHVKPQASIIHYKQYRQWRETGIAFEFGDETYTMPNRSLASFALGRERGMSKLRRGFWTDVQVSPYFAWGTDCDRTNQHANDLFKIVNKGTATEQHRYTAVHVAVFNVLSMLYTLECGKSYSMRRAGDLYSGVERPADLKKFASECTEGIMQLKDRVSIILLTGDSVQTALTSRSRYKDHFDGLWLSNSAAHLVADTGVHSMLRTKACSNILVEGVRNMAMLERPKKAQYTKSVRDMAHKAGLYELPSRGSKIDNECTDSLEPEFLTFVSRVSSSS